MPAIVYAHLAQRCCDVRGRTRMAEALGIEVEDMRRICRGLIVPSYRQRELLDRWFATLFAMELDDDGYRMACQCDGDNGRP